MGFHLSCVLIRWGYLFSKAFVGSLESCHIIRSTHEDFHIYRNLGARMEQYDYVYYNRVVKD